MEGGREIDRFFCLFENACVSNNSALLLHLLGTSIIIMIRSGVKWYKRVEYGVKTSKFEGVGRQMFGKFQHNLDDKGRVSIPAKLREYLGRTFMITIGLDGCLAIYPMDEWEIVVSKFRGLTNKEGRALQRFLFSNAGELEPDKQGRVLIPETLRKHAGLDKNVVIVGASERVEIWDAQKWEDNQTTFTDEDYAAMMENF